MREHHLILEVVICLLSCAPCTSAQSAPQHSGSEGWRFQEIPYLWGPSLNGRLGVNDRTADVHASFSNILDHLHFAVMNLRARSAFGWRWAPRRQRCCEW